MSRDLEFGPGLARGEKQATRALDDLKLCPFPSCPELIPRRARGCAAHKNIMTDAEVARRRAHPRNLVYRDARWKRTRAVVFERDDWTCQNCFNYRDETGRTLICDHVNEGGVMACPDPFDPAYCATKCRVCSGKKDGPRGGGSRLKNSET